MKLKEEENKIAFFLSGKVKEEEGDIHNSKWKV